MIESVLNSNLVQVVMTFGSGAVLYVLAKRYPYILSVTGYLISCGIFFSFLFNYGEVYSYSALYKRAFFVFGDGITTVLLLFFLYAVLSEEKLLSVCTAVSIIMSGGKVSLALIPIMVTIIYVLTKKEGGRHISLSFLKNIFYGVLIYSATLLVSGFTEQTEINTTVRSFTYDFAVEYNSFLRFIQSNLGFQILADGEEYKVNHSLRGGGNCETIVRCFETQIKRTFLYRYYSSLAGLWMTLEGGFRGERYPTSSSDFAALMIRENPWGINDKYGLDFNDWKKMRAPHNPYLRFGAGYGPWFLGILLGGLLSIVLVAWINLLKGERGADMAFSIYFIVVVVFDQTQPWILSGSWILCQLGFCSFHILATWLSREHGLPELFHPLGVCRIEGPRNKEQRKPAIESVG